MHVALVRAVHDRDPAAWKRFKVSKPAKQVSPPKAIPGNRRAPARKLVKGRKDVKGRLAPMGYGVPVSGNGLVGTSGCVSSGSSHLRAVASGALGKWAFCSLECKNASFLAGGFGRDFLPPVRVEGGPSVI